MKAGQTTGFTLIEVVVAVAIFATASVVLTSAFVNALLAREFGNRNALLEGDLRAIRMQLLLEPDLEAAEDGGDYRTYSAGEAEWTAEIEPTNVIDLFEVQLTIEFRNPPKTSTPPTRKPCTYSAPHGRSPRSAPSFWPRNVRHYSIRGILTR